MHPQNPHPQPPYLVYRQPFQNSNLVQMHIPQPVYPNIHFVHRIEPHHVQSNNISKQRQQIQKNAQNKLNISPYINQVSYGTDVESEQISFRKDQNRINNSGGYLNQSLPSRNQIPALESIQLAHIQAFPHQAQKPKSHMSVRRKDSMNANNSKEVREEYYKGQLQMDQLMNKLPQIQIQTLNKTINCYGRQFHMSPSGEPKNKEGKKANSPFVAYSRSMSYKENGTVDSVYIKKTEVQENLTGSVKSTQKQTYKQFPQSREKSKEILKFHSPAKNFQVPRRLNQDVAVLSPHDVNPQRGGVSSQKIKQREKSNEKSKEKQKSKDLTYKRKQSNTDTSNSASTCFETQSLRSTSWSTGLMGSYKLRDSYTQAKKTSIQSECQTQPHLYAQYILSQPQPQSHPQPHAPSQQLQDLKHKLQTLQCQLSSQRSTNQLKQLAIKTMQHQLNTIKIISQKKLLQLQKQLINKKQNQILNVKEEYENKILRIILENKEIKDNYLGEIRNMEQKISYVVGQMGEMEGKVRIGVERMAVLSKERDQFASKAIEQQTKIAELIIHQNKIQDQRKSLFQTTQQLQKTITNLQQKLQHSQSRSSTPLKQQLKTAHPIIMSKIQMQRLHRRLQQLNTLLCQKDIYLKDLIKDLRNRDRQVIQLKKGKQNMEKLMKDYCQEIVLMKLKIKNAKYQVCDEQEDISQGILLDQEKLQQQNTQEVKQF